VDEATPRWKLPLGSTVTSTSPRIPVALITPNLYIYHIIIIYIYHIIIIYIEYPQRRGQRHATLMTSPNLSKAIRALYNRSGSDINSVILSLSLSPSLSLSVPGRAVIRCGNAFFHQTTNGGKEADNWLSASFFFFDNSCPPVVRLAFPAALVVRWKNAFPH